MQNNEVVHSIARTWTNYTFLVLKLLCMFTDLRNLMQNLSTFLLLVYFILPFTDVWNFSDRK